MLFPKIKLLIEENMGLKYFSYISPFLTMGNISKIVKAIADIHKTRKCCYLML